MSFQSVQSIEIQVILLAKNQALPQLVVVQELPLVLILRKILFSQVDLIKKFLGLDAFYLKELLALLQTHLFLNYLALNLLKIHSFQSHRIGVNLG